MLLQGQVGPQTQADGNFPNVRQGRLGELFVSDAIGKYYEIARRGQLFMSSMQAAASLGTVLTATAVTLTLYNPIGSTTNLVMLQCNVSISGVGLVTNAVNFVYAATPGMSTGLAPTATTNAKVFPGLILAGGVGQATGIGQCYTAATLGATAPVAVRAFPTGIQVISTVINNWLSLPGVYDYVDGALVLGPGVAVTLQAIATVAPTGIVSFVWAEIPN